MKKDGKRGKETYRERQKMRRKRERQRVDAEERSGKYKGKWRERGSDSLQPGLKKERGDQQHRGCETGWKSERGCEKEGEGEEAREETMNGGVICNGISWQQWRIVWRDGRIVVC